MSSEKDLISCLTEEVDELKDRIYELTNELDIKKDLLYIANHKISDLEETIQKLKIKYEQNEQ